MKNTRKVALYSPYLDVLGGGERHILSILKVFDDLGYNINLIWEDESIINKIKDKLSLTFKAVSVTPNFLSNKNPILTLKKTAEFDFFFYVTDGSYFASRAKKNYIFAMVPNKDLYKMNLLNRLKTHNFSFISNSGFTKLWLKKWEINSSVIYPYIDDSYFIKTEEISKKEQIILSVGRFFPHLHSKKHKEIIDLFKKYKQINPETNKMLFLVGGLDDKDKKYFDEVTKTASNRSDIVIKDNISESDLKLLYKRASYYWHFTGFGINEEKNPEKLEHLGITPLEAMAAGCTVFCYNAGGPKEYINTGKNGYLFTTEDELFSEMDEVIQASNQEKIGTAAVDYVRRNFSYDIFKKNVTDYFEL